MRFESAKAFGQGLKFWRETFLKNLSLAKIGARSKYYTDPTAQQFRKIEDGKAFPNLKVIIEDVFHAYEIGDLDRFILGSCPPRLQGLSEVQHLRQGNGKEVGQIGPAQEYGGAIRYGISDTRFLGRIPIRVDRFVIPKGRKSDTIQHSGYNYLLVTKGRVRCHLQEEESGKSEAPILETGEALLFPTKLWHSIEAIGKEETAEFIVAAPRWAHDDLKKKQDNHPRA
jgi:quercetin dioxygenase-like cupin family protein